MFSSYQKLETFWDLEGCLKLCNESGIQSRWKTSVSLINEVGKQGANAWAKRCILLFTISSNGTFTSWKQQQSWIHTIIAKYFLEQPGLTNNQI